jgi:hypothetical protein
MEKTYKDPDKARSVMYASIRAGRISGIDPTFERRMKRQKQSSD